MPAQSTTVSEKAPPSIEEHAVTFVSEGLTFPATITMPATSNKAVPIVVLVAGSGPSDADETIGPNKPFRDIAQALAAKGIATLRYPKRSHLAPKTMAGDLTTLDWEVTRDAVAALAFAQTQKGIDPHKVFLLGHSLGGTMAPIIAANRLKQSPGSVAGIILLAPGVLPVDVTLTRQILAQQKRAGATPDQLVQVKTAVDTMFAGIRDPSTPADKSMGLGALQLPERYWREWLAQNPVGELHALGLPSLVLRGDKDIQVAHEDYATIIPAQSATQSAHAELPELNHLFMPVEGESTGAEYMKPSHVAAAATDLIASWIVAIH